MLNVVMPIWRFRHLILSAIRAELRGRFARSKLGGLWYILHPLAQAAIFALILTEVLGTKLAGVNRPGAYALYLLSGMAAWGLFAEILNRCLSIFIEYGSLMKKISFPRLSLPVIVWGGALLNHALLLSAMVVVFAFFGQFPSFLWLALIPGVILISMFAFGLGVFLGIINVFSRDVAQLMSVTMQMWFWLTPVIYPLEALPPSLRSLVALNPMAPLVGLYQQVLVYGRLPDFSSLIWPAFAALAFFALAFFVFQRASAEIVDAL